MTVMAMSGIHLYKQQVVWSLAKMIGFVRLSACEVFARNRGSNGQPRQRKEWRKRYALK